MEMRPALERAEDEPARSPGALRGWIIEGEIGRGGMGRVFRARHQKTRARAAIKVLLGDYARRPDVVARFRQEAIAVNIINHPGIVRVFDSGELEDGSPYIVMEYLDGRGLRDWVQAVPAADRPRQVVRLGYQIASAMAAAHASKVVHRDLKPENILVIDDELAPGGSRVKILDFGIAKVLWGGLPEVLELDGSGPLAPALAARTELSAQPVATVAAAPVLAAEGEAAEEEALRSVPAVSAERPAVVHATVEAPLEHPSPSSSVEAPLERPAASSPRGLAEPAPASEGAGQPTMPFTQEGVWGLGTRSYMAPEQERHSGSVDVKADVYSLGVILVELLEGRTPDAPGGAWPPPMSAGTPPDLVALVHRVLSFEPEARPHMAEVAAALHRLGRAKQEFDEALSRWVRGGKAPKLLPRGKALHELTAWSSDIDDLSALERGFLEAASAAEARRERFTRMLLALGVVVLMGMVATTTVFWVHATRARRTAEAAERAARDHSRLEAAANASAQEALQKMSEAQRATAAALALAMKASDDAKSANSEREAMTEAKRLAEQAELRARRAAGVAAAAKAEADARYAESKDALEREIAALSVERDHLLRELGRAEEERERTRAILGAREHELRTARQELRGESMRALLLERKLGETLAQIDELEAQRDACAARLSRAPPSPGAPVDGSMGPGWRDELPPPPIEPPADPGPPPPPFPPLRRGRRLF
ncbi:protein kinase [Sorangium sp. So ce1036]|uniref:serine/threonine-protein kinase n=1 Tax=Sorangium sp. So ce1036 TaxID=3133328 RepID=UPI003F02D46F